MKIILLSGGSGKRLWPLSNDSRSKQFLKLLSNEKNEMVSMVEKVYKQLENVGLGDNTYIATSNSQIEILKKQLGTKVKIIAEPSRRDTFPAIGLASSYLYSVENISLTETIVVLPVDPFVSDDFFKKVKELEKLLFLTNTDLGLIGIKPTYPSQKYGYIMLEEVKKGMNYYSVRNFIEKPNEETAKILLSQNAYWNSGVFAFKLGYITDILQNEYGYNDFETVKKHYNDLEKISFDYKVVENAGNVTTLIYNDYWKDLGTWNTLTEEMRDAIIGKGILHLSANTNIINELDVPIAVLGIDNAVIVASSDGILVSSKEESPKIKEIVGNLNKLPQYEEFIWGNYKIIKNTQENIVKFYNIDVNESYSFMSYNAMNINIIKGIGEVKINEKKVIVKEYDVLKINQNELLSIKAIEHLEFIVIEKKSNIVTENEVENNVMSLK